MGGTGFDNAWGIAVDDAGNVYTTGAFSNTADFDPGPELFNLTSAGLGDIFVLKLDNAGDFVWAKAMGGEGWNSGTNITVDGTGNVFTTGSFWGTVDFNSGPETFNLASTGHKDIFVLKLNSDGNYVWSKAMGGTENDHGLNIVVDGAGGIYTTGVFSDTADFDPGPSIFNLTSAGEYDIFVSKLDSAGDFVWAKAMGGTRSDSGCGIAVDGAGNIYTTGDFLDTADFDPSPETFNLTAAGNYDIFVSKLDSFGSFVWAKAIGGTSSDCGRSIAIDGIGNAYTTGSFVDTVDFDPGSEVFNLSSAGYCGDIFVSKLDSTGVFVWAKSMGGKEGGDSGDGVAVDTGGNVYITGDFYGTSDFDPGPGTFELTLTGDTDVFVMKLAGHEVEGE